MKISTKVQADQFLAKYIPKSRWFKFPGDIGLKRTKYLLKLLGEPQNKLKIIHIAGTSGKGSTAFFLSSILRNQGFSVGLSVSPILLDTRERFQINNKLISEKEFYKYLNEIVPAVKITEEKYGAPTHFEILAALTFYIFFKMKVDYAVIETGLGGLLDATNVITSQNKIAIITQIGHDHMTVLGHTLDKITFQKAGIIQLNNSVITTKQNPKVINVISDVVSKKKGKLFLVDRTNIKNVSLLPEPKFDFTFQEDVINNIKLAMLGSFQIQNCSLALAATTLLSKRDKFVLDEKKIRYALKNAVFPGRMQRISLNGQTIIIDGAHNPQKMKAFTTNLKLYFSNQKFVFVVAFKMGKSYKTILHYITPIAKEIIVTPFANQTKAQGFSVLSEEAEKLTEIFQSLNFKNYSIVKNSKEALNKLFQDKNSVGVITGSLYLISEVYPFLIDINGTYC